ncbi:MAG: pyruvate dehydrogenase (acetyl-transferring) E1 component subunit alpha [Nitrospiria bacterium]
MPKKILEKFSVAYVQILNESAGIDSSDLPETSQFSEKTLKDFYESMVLIRAIDDKALNLQRTGRIGTYASIQGQEAIQAGCAAALQRSDWLFPAFRETGLSALRGMSIKGIYQYWSGDERGNVPSGGQHDFPVSIPVGTHIPHAVGAAWAAKYKKDPIAVLTTFGDGATSKGDFHEGLNFAGVFKLPVVFVCQNNQWAISVPLARQTASATLAQKAIGYGFDGIQVDGNDVLAVYTTVKAALEKARRGDGPTLIECLTYRLNDHTTADDASRYRSNHDVLAWREKDPVTRLKTYLEQHCGWSSKDETTLMEGIERRIAEAVKDYEAEASFDPLDMFDFLFETLPPDLLRQREMLVRRLNGQINEDAA